MTVSKKDGYWYGTEDADVQDEIGRYSQEGYRAVKFAQALCPCGGTSFKLESDETEGVGRRTCSVCGAVKLMGDSAEYASDAELETHSCVCDHNQFGIVSGVALYSDSNDVRWYYIGCRCRSCHLVGVFADWKCEGGDADDFLGET